jgi:hypothetical protein
VAADRAPALVRGNGNTSRPKRIDEHEPRSLARVVPGAVSLPEDVDGTPSPSLAARSRGVGDGKPVVHSPVL